MQYTLTNVRMERVKCQQIDRISQQSFQLKTHLHEREQTWHMCRVKLHKHIDIAVQTKIPAQHRAEQSQTDNVMPLTELGDDR